MRIVLYKATVCRHASFISIRMNYNHSTQGTTGNGPPPVALSEGRDLLVVACSITAWWEGGERRRVRLVRAVRVVRVVKRV